MNMNEIVKYCLSKKASTETYPFGPEPIVIKVCSKMFALISENNDHVSISLKCDPYLAQTLRYQYKSVIPGYHLNKEHWNTVNIDGTIPVDQIMWMIDHSYECVAGGLTKKEKELIK